jgi:molybdopterin synthase sulfur carrier subunit
MKVELRLFANLRKKLPPGSPRGKCDLELPDGTTLGQLLERMDIPRPSAQMVLINGDHDRNFDRLLQDGDVLSIFPPVAGGSDSQRSIMSTWDTLPRPLRKLAVVGALAAIVGGGARLAFAEVGASSCPGDCNGDGTTTIDELLIGVRIALGDISIDRCSAMDEKHDGNVDVADLVAAVHVTLTGCQVPTATPSPTPPPEATAGTGLRTVRLTVEAIDDAPIDGFAARFDERGKRTRSQTIDVQSGATTTYTVKDVAAAIVVLVSVDGYYSSVGVVDPPADPGQAAMSDPLRIRLVPKGRCIKLSDECAGQTAGGPFAPGDVLVGMDAWLWPDEVDVALEPYCQLIDGLDQGKTVSLWVDVVQGDPQAAIASLRASASVQFADVRGFDGAPVTGTSMLIVFGPGVTINAARDLIDSINGLRWLRTDLSPASATVHVEVGQEAAWVCQLKQDPNVAYATLNNIITAPLR